jgi:HEAT repeat protein
MSVSQAAQTTEGKPIPPRRIRRGLGVSILASATGMFWVATAFGMPVTMFMECLGGSALMVGLIVTIQQVSTAAQIPAAFMAERMRARKPLWALTALVHRLLWFLPALVPLIVAPRSSAARWMLIVMLAISAVLQQMGVPLWFSWMSDLIPSRMRSRFWGYRQSVVMAVHLVALVFVGYLLDAYPDPRQGDGGSYTGFVLVFLIAGISGTLDILIHWWVPEPENAPPTPGAGLVGRLLAPLKVKDFRWLTLAVGVWMLSVGLVGSFGILYLSRVYGVSYTDLSITMFSASIGTIVAGMLWGRLIDVIGARALGATLMLIAPFMGVVWFFMTHEIVRFTLPLFGSVSLRQPVAVLLLANVFAGAIYSGVALCHLNLIGALAPREGRTMCMAVHWTLIGALGAFGPLLGGLVTDWVTQHPMQWKLPTGADVGFMHVLVLLQCGVVLFVAVPFLLRVSNQGHELPVNLLIGNPLRAAGVVANLGALASAVSPSRRARAAMRLSGSGHAVVIADLAERLDDPAAEVREAAAQSLGRIATDEAVDVLIAKLDDDRSTMAPQIARSLWHSRHPRSVDALVNRLSDPDRETRTESARTLGAIGDPRAVPPLLELLQNTTDEKVVSASSEALSRLGDLAALHAIVPRMRATKNPVFKRSLAVAVGDLLGTRDEFYLLLAREEDDRGVEVSSRLASLRRAVRRATRARDVSARAAVIRECIDRVELAYEEQRLATAAAELFALAKELAGLRWGIHFGPDQKPAFDELIWREPRLGIGFWYVRTLGGELPRFAAADDWVEILLGIYLVTQWRP